MLKRSYYIDIYKKSRSKVVLLQKDYISLKPYVSNQNRWCNQCRHQIATLIKKRPHIFIVEENPISPPEVPQIIRYVLAIHMQTLVTN